MPPKYHAKACFEYCIALKIDFCYIMPDKPHFPPHPPAYQPYQGQSVAQPGQHTVFGKINTKVLKNYNTVYVVI